MASSTSRSLLLQLRKTTESLAKLPCLQLCGPYKIQLNNATDKDKVLSTNPKFASHWWRHCMITFIGSLLITYRFKYDSKLLHEKLWNINFFGMTTFSTLLYIVQHLHYIDFSSFFNQVVHFEATLARGLPIVSYTQRKNIKVAKGLCKLFFCVYLIDSSLFPLTSVILKSAPWSFMPSLSQPNSFLRWFLLPVVEFWLNYNIFKSSYHIIIHVLLTHILVSTLFLKCCILLLSQHSKSNSISNNYRAIMLLCKMYNDIHATSFIPGAIVADEVSSICLWYSVIKAQSEEVNYIFKTWFAFTAFAALSIISLFFQFAADINPLSIEVLRNWKPKGAKNQRIKRSLQPLRIGLGESNFFDKTTPLVLTQFAVDNLVTVILL